MKDLVKWQMVSFISRGIAMAIGIIQSIFVVRILTVSEYGMIGIVAAIGSVFGVTQHLGLASGSTREISAAKNNQDVFKIFFTAVLIRYTVTIPLAIGLFVFSEYLAVAKYSNPDLIVLLRIYSLVLLIQGVQSMFNSVISGTHRFKQLFVYQSVIAFISLLLYLPLIYLFRVTGYFVALVLFNLIGSISLGYIALKPLHASISFPSKDDFKRLLKEILSISLGVYVVKVVYTLWQRSGPILLGVSVTPQEVGYFSFALFYGAKLMHISDSVTDVNLPVLSREFTKNVENFKNLFTKNFDKVYVFTIFSAVSAVYWAREIFHLAVGSTKYDSSLSLVFPTVFAFVFYAMINIIKSSVLVPSKMVKEMIVGYVLMLLSTVGFYLVFTSKFGSLAAMALGMTAGSLLSFLVLVTLSQIKLKFVFFNVLHFFLLVLGGVMCYLGGGESVLMKFSLYFGFVCLYVFILFKSHIISKSEVAFVLNRLRRK